MKILIKGFLIGFAFKVILFGGDILFYLRMGQQGFLEGRMAAFQNYWGWLSNPLSLLYQRLFIHRVITEDGAMIYVTRFDSVIITLTSWLFYPFMFMIGYVLFSKWKKKKEKIRGQTYVSD